MFNTSIFHCRFEKSFFLSIVYSMNLYFTCELSPRQQYLNRLAK